MRRSLIAVALTLAVLGIPGAPAAQETEQKTTDSLGQLQVFSVNIHLFKQAQFDSGKWKRFINRITNSDVYEYMPDILLVQEISLGFSDDVVRYLNQQTGTEYGYRHALANTATDFEAGSWKMVVWRKDRLKLATGSNSRDVLKWRELQTRQDNSTNCQVSERRAISVRLEDKSVNATVAATSVHWSPHPEGSARACDYKNMRRTERTLENKWAQRDLTIVGGDFNQVPQDGETEEAGRERDPECWWRNVFGTYADDSGPCDDAQLSYYDSVYLAHSGADNQTTDSICDQWTHARSKGPDGSTSCQDSDGDGSRDKSRIDYIWLRWEDGSGDIEKPSLADARGRIGLARADQISWVESSPYSDHRAVVARVTP